MLSAYLPGESPFSSNKIPSPDTPVKLVFIRKSSSVAPSIGRMASHKPLKQMKRRVMLNKQFAYHQFNNHCFV